MSFVGAKAQQETAVDQVCQDIAARTGLLSLSTDQFRWKTIWYYMRSTGIPVNFGITIALGFFVGVAVAGQTFYLFTIENLKQFGNLKAMGVTNNRLVGMILLQAGLLRFLGVGIALGTQCLFL